MNYYESHAIGSTVLKTSFESFDKLNQKSKTTVYFEFGKAFEDYVECIFTGKKYDRELIEMKTVPINLYDMFTQVIYYNSDGKSYFESEKQTVAQKRLQRAYESYKKTGYVPLIKSGKRNDLTHIDKMFGNLIKNPVVNGLTLGQMNELNPLVFQKEYFTRIDGIEVRAKIDILWEYKDVIYPIDLKTTQDLDRYSWVLKKGGYWQSYHYDNIITNEYTGFSNIEPMRFLASDKTKPYLSKVFKMDYTNEHIHDKYIKQLHKLKKWYKDGKQKIGYLEPEIIEIYNI